MPHNDSLNQTPKQNARDIIDRQLTAAGWAVQKKSAINWHVSAGIALTLLRRAWRPGQNAAAFRGTDGAIIDELNEVLTA